MADPSEKLPVFGVAISPTTYAMTCQAIANRPTTRAFTIACCNVHSIMEARRNPDLSSALNTADIAAPDGMPVVWALNRIHDAGLRERVYGPELMLATLRFGIDRRWRHFFFGATEPTLGKLRANLQARIPGVRVVGCEAPPFAPLGEQEVAAAAERIRRTEADVAWIGLGMPKQELLMPRLASRLPGVAIAGVGAAFDFVAGTIPQAPVWMQARGLEWAFRLAHEPRRLWKRYALNNPAYLALLGTAVLRRALSNSEPGESRRPPR